MEKDVNSAEQSNERENLQLPIRWEYKVVHVNINNDSPPQSSTPESDSKKLQGALSPEFIKREFPEMYQQSTSQSKNPVEEMQDFLNLLGNDGWELVEISKIGVFMLFFKRLRP